MLTFVHCFVAGLVVENWRSGRQKHMWVSIGSDLRIDTRRDLDDVGATDIAVHPLNKLPYGPLNSAKVYSPCARWYCLASFCCIHNRTCDAPGCLTSESNLLLAHCLVQEYNANEYQHVLHGTDICMPLGS